MCGVRMPLDRPVSLVRAPRGRIEGRLGTATSGSRARNQVVPGGGWEPGPRRAKSGQPDPAVGTRLVLQPGAASTAPPPCEIHLPTRSLLIQLPRVLREHPI